MGVALKDMGTTGLINFLKSIREKNRYYHLQKGRVRKIIEARFPKTDKQGYNVSWARFCNCL
jgi:hypothetical protein